jgi:hypothetical protein
LGSRASAQPGGSVICLAFLAVLIAIFAVELWWLASC